MVEYRNGNIEIIGRQIEDNYIQLNYEDYFISYLNPDIQGNKGASSNIFILHDPAGELEDRVIKICKTPLSSGRNRKLKRFEREIKAFKKVKRNKLNKIIEFFQDGQLTIGREEFLYIILEKANNDLTSFLEENHFDFSISQKLNFCINILYGIKSLHAIGIYHRDIKPDNIFVVQNELKIGDLGLVDFQDKDFEFDYPNEKVGPFAWLSPEATNKIFTKNKDIGYIYDCDIDQKSDIFQLGKLFWYIFQGNLPLGQLLNSDCKFEDNDIFSIIFSMLHHDKINRPEIDVLLELIEPIKYRLAV